MKVYCGFPFNVRLGVGTLGILIICMCLSVTPQALAQNAGAAPDYITVKFNVPVVDIPIGQTRAAISDVRSNMENVRSFFANLGVGVVFEKVIPGARPGDTIYVAPSGSIRKLHDWSQVFRVRFLSPVAGEKLIPAIRQLPEVEYAQPPVQIESQRTPDDLNLNGNQWYLTKLQAQQAWDLTTGSSSVKIALIEEGVYQHNDLTGKLVGGETGYTGSHGVEVAGVAGAATNNGSGIASLGWNVSVVPMNSGNASGLEADILQAATPTDLGGEGARVINCSFKTIYPSVDVPHSSHDYPSVQEAIENAQAYGALVVASAGNPPGDNDLDVVPYTAWPAAYAGVIAVSATNSSDQFPSGYNYGDSVDVSGPAIDIQTLALSNGYVRVNGTSFAAPLTSAIAGLIWSLDPNLSATQVASAIKLSADDLGSAGWDNHFGYGRINANKAVRNLYVPQEYSTVSAALSKATSGQTVVLSSGNYTIDADVNVHSGVTLQLNSANLTVSADAIMIMNAGSSLQLNSSTFTIGGFSVVSGANITSTSSTIVVNNMDLTIPSGSSLQATSSTFRFASSRKLRIQGTITTSGSCTFTNSSGQWYGIEFYNSPNGSSLYGATIENAQYGVYAYNSAVTVSHNTIQNNSTGMYMNQYTPGVGWNVFSGNSSYGLDCANYSNFNITSNNVIRYNSTDGVRGDGTSQPNLGNLGAPGANSLYYNGSWDVYTSYPSTIWACGNYWADGPYVSPVVRTDNELGFDPNAKIAVHERTVAEAGAATTLDDTTGLGECDALYQAKLTGQAVPAQAFQALVGKYPNSLAGRMALAHWLQAADGSEDPASALKTVAQQEAGKAVAKTARMFLIGALVKMGSLQEAYTVSQALVADADPLTLKEALFNAGTLGWYSLANREEGEGYFQRLIAEYPDDPLAASARSALGIAPVKAAAKGTPPEAVPSAFDLLPSYPNPFNPSTTIRFALASEASVHLAVYDVLGREVARLTDGPHQAGYHTVTWNAQHVASGLYFARLTVANELGRTIFSKTDKLMLTR